MMTLKEARLKRNYTQQKLADAIGVTRQAVSEWERGLSIPDVNTGKRIAAELRVDLNEIEFAGRRRVVAVHGS